MEKIMKTTKFAVALSIMLYQKLAHMAATASV